MRLIDADALTEELCENCPYTAKNRCREKPMCFTVLALQDAEAVDAVSADELEELLYKLYDESFISRFAFDEIRNLIRKHL